MNTLKVVFLGTPDFAVESLKAIDNSAHQIVGVVTMPDKKMGRGRKLQGSAVKKYAEEKGHFLMQPEKLKNPDFISELENLQADIFVVVAFRMLPEMVWNMPEHGTVNVHGSLLPQYRGAAPINWAIINGEKETGVTVFRLKHEIDTGDILLRKSLPIGENENVEDIHDKMMVIGGQAVVEGLNLIASGNPSYLPQLESADLKPAPKIFKDTCKINWNQSVDSIHNFIRGLSPYPSSWTTLLNGDQPMDIKIYQANPVKKTGNNAGKIETDGKSFLHIYGSDGYLEIKELQIPGKRKMPISDLLRGFTFDNSVSISQ